MKKATIFLFGLAFLVTQACKQKNQKDNQPLVAVVNNQVKVDPKQKVLEDLDQILSPFDDITEFALGKMKQEF